MVFVTCCCTPSVFLTFLIAISYYVKFTSSFQQYRTFVSFKSSNTLVSSLQMQTMGNSFNVKTLMRKWLASATIASVTTFSPPLNHIHSSSVAHAAIAPLADVGVKEFLVKDGEQFLRLSIPLGKDQKYGTSPAAVDLRSAQENLELVRLRFEQVGVTNPGIWGTALKDVSTAANIIKSNTDFLLSNKQNSAQALWIFDNVLSPQLTRLADAIRDHNVKDTLDAQQAAADALGDLRLLQLPDKELPYKIPEEYAALPRLTGRAVVEVEVESKKGFRPIAGDSLKVPKVTFTIELDGYHAPITCGNFIDLVNKKFYDGMKIDKVEELVVQTGSQSLKSNKDTEGYVDPKTGNVRYIPLELFYKADAEPVYGITSDDDLRATDAMLLPFQTFGAVGMARQNEDVDSASSQFFLLKWNQALIAPGRNTLDGFYTCFGYVTKNADILSQINEATDRIITAKVVSGMEHFVPSG